MRVKVWTLHCRFAHVRVPGCAAKRSGKGASGGASSSTARIAKMMERLANSESDPEQQQQQQLQQQLPPLVRLDTRWTLSLELTVRFCRGIRGDMLFASCVCSRPRIRAVSHRVRCVRRS